MNGAKILFILSSLLSSASAFAQADAKDTRNEAVLVGINGSRNVLKAGDGNEFVGNSGSLSIGLSHIGLNYFVYGAFDMILGPYEPTRERQLIVDYSGTGLTAMAGISAQDSDIRTMDGGYGFAVGLRYWDVQGKSVSKNQEEPVSKSGNIKYGSDLFYDYHMHVTSIAFSPALFFSWLGDARKKGNSPEQLMTRIEGEILTLGFDIPITTKYVASYAKRPANSETVNPQQTERGTLKGYSVFINYSIFLGF